MNRPKLFIKKAKDNCNVMDVGCGPGTITHDELYPLFPKTINELVAIDISPEMIEYAKSHYEANTKIKFSVMDILTDDVPSDHKNHFDYITSLYCLHFVSDHRKALSNIHEMLKPGGKIFLNHMAKCSTLDIYKYMATKDEWKAVFANLENIIPPTQYCDDSKSYYENLLKEVGFVPQLCSVKEKMHSYTKEIYDDLALAVASFDIPHNMKKKFLFEHLEYARICNYIRTDERNEIYIDLPYTLLTVCATKLS
ncbi:hypothetical protein FQA39_LY00846 [Lamprigera yunnana]|nr:hypothetical protein FQA39_LY00846 [Lamprigera yunnana]